MLNEQIHSTIAMLPISLWPIFRNNRHPTKDFPDLVLRIKKLALI
jgi:hypothetical protein